MCVHCDYSVTKFSKAETPFVHDNESVSSHKHGINFLGLVLSQARNIQNNYTA